MAKRFFFKKQFFTILPHTVVKAGMSYSLLVLFYEVFLTGTRFVK